MRIFLCMCTKWEKEIMGRLWSSKWGWGGWQSEMFLPAESEGGRVNEFTVRRTWAPPAALTETCKQVEWSRNRERRGSVRCDVQGSDCLLSDSEPHIPTLLDRTPPCSTIDFKKRLPVSEDILHVQTKKTWGGVNTQLWSHKMQCSFWLCLHLITTFFSCTLFSLSLALSFFN